MKKYTLALALVLLPGLAFANSGIWISSARIASLAASGTEWTRITADADDCSVAAGNNEGTYNLFNQNNTYNVCCLANALKYAKDGSSTNLSRAVACINSFIAHSDDAASDPNNDRVLAVSREAQTAPIIADLINLPTYNPTLNSSFRTALSYVITRNDLLSGPTSIKNCTLQRPNNWGGHCVALRVAADIYLGDTTDLATAANIVKGFFGETGGYNGFDYGDADLSSSRDDWQDNCPIYGGYCASASDCTADSTDADSTTGDYCRATTDSSGNLCESGSYPTNSARRCYGINPSGATRLACSAVAAPHNCTAATNADCGYCTTNGDCTGGGVSSSCNSFNIDGVIPDDQRRTGSPGFFFSSGSFENQSYAYESLQGWVVAAAMLYNYNSTSYPAFTWGDHALKRALGWLYSNCVSSVCTYRGGACSTNGDCGNGYPPTGDDYWIPAILNYYEGTSFPLGSSPSAGKGMGYADWTHQGTLASACDGTTSCANLTKDCGETDVDCGGVAASGCSTCANGSACAVNADCTSTFCASGSTGLCAAPPTTTSLPPTTTTLAVTTTAAPTTTTVVTYPCTSAICVE